MFLSESCTNSASWCSTACTVKRLSTSWNYSRRCRITATSSIRHPTASTSSRTASPAQLLWPTGFLCGWSVGLEFAAGQLAESDYWRNSFIQFLKTFLFATYWCIQRIRGFTTMHYINRLFTYFYLLKSLDEMCCQCRFCKTCLRHVEKWTCITVRQCVIILWRSLMSTRTHVMSADACWLSWNGLFQLFSCFIFQIYNIRCSILTAYRAQREGNGSRCLLELLQHVEIRRHSQYDFHIMYTVKRFRSRMLIVCIQ